MKLRIAVCFFVVAICAATPLQWIAPSRFSAAVAFSPSDIAGLSVWYKADALSLSDGDPVSTWADSSGSANDASGSSTARPTYKAAIVNSKPVVRFDGSNDTMAAASVSVSQPDTVFLVVKNSGGTYNRIYFNGSTTRQQVWSDNSNLLLYFAGSVVSTSNDLGTASFHVIAITFNGASSQAWVDGVSLGTGSANTNALVGLVLGTDGSDYFQGDMAEFLIYDSALGSTNRQSVETYLGTKYAITITH